MREREAEKQMGGGGVLVLWSKESLEFGESLNANKVPTRSCVMVSGRLVYQRHYLYTDRGEGTTAFCTEKRRLPLESFGVVCICSSSVH